MWDRALRFFSSPILVALGLLLLVDSVYSLPPALAVLGLSLLALARLAGYLRWRRLPAVPEALTPRDQLATLASGAVFVALAFYFFRSWEVAWVVLASLAVHELGHLVAARLLGVPALIGFGPLGAWTWTPAARRHALSQSANTLIHLAGPIASLAYAFLALSWHVGAGDGGDYWLRLANLNALLCLLNLLPLGGLSDGGKTLRRLIGAANRQTQQELRLLFMLLPLVVGWGLLNLPLTGARVVVLVGVVLWYGLALLLAGRGPAPSSRIGQIRPRRARALLGLVMALLLFSAGLVVFTPFWLTEGHAYGMVLDHGRVVYYVLARSPLAMRLGLVVAGLLLAMALRLGARRDSAAAPIPRATGPTWSARRRAVTP